MNENMLVWDSISGKFRPAWVIQIVDQFFTKLNDKPVWETIDFFIKTWEKLYPQEVTEFYSSIKEIQKTRARPTASSKSKDIRYLAEVPARVKYLIDKFLEDRVNTNSVKFMREFAKRYPQFKVPSKI